MTEFYPAMGSSLVFGPVQILSNLLMAFLLCSVFASVYRWTFGGLSYSRGYIHTLVIGGMVVAMVIMAIGNNLARGLGILGTLAIIRFRTPIRDARDLIFLFASLGTGVGCGAGAYDVALIGTGTISSAMVLLHWSPFASRREYEGMLRFLLPADTRMEGSVEEILRHCCSSFHMIAMRESIQGEMIEYSYQIKLVDPSYQAEIIDRLHQVEDVMDPTLLMQRQTVEL